MPERFVRELFDQYADHFDTHLRDALNYTGPALVAEALRQAGRGPFHAVLDLGCGTGLMARALTPHADAIDGVDLAPRMVEHARATGLYRSVAVGEIVAFASALPAGIYDAVLAADVFVYLGDLAPVFAQAARVLRSGGILAFTVQRGQGGAYELGPDMRFHHGEAYVARALIAAGLELAICHPSSTREDRGVPVPGLVVAARRP